MTRIGNGFKVSGNENTPQTLSDAKSSSGIKEISFQKTFSAVQSTPVV
jgi:hypothetical protein